ncbi:MAG: EAL domain-containing protein [Gemmatimonadales bacterium]
MTLQPKPLQSRFGRRLLLLFVGCALVPIAVVAVVSYGHVTRQLHIQSESRLHQANKALGLAIFERLLLLDATLKSIPPGAVLQLGAAQREGKPRARTELRLPSSIGNRTQSARIDGRYALGGVVVERGPRRPAPTPAAGEGEASRTLIAGLDLLARRRFVALEFVADDGDRIEIFGRLDELPPLTPADSADLSYGLPLVTSQQMVDRPARVYLLRRMERLDAVRGTLVGEISPEFLWGTLDLSMPSPATRVRVVDDSGRVLVSATNASQVSQDELLSQATRPQMGSAEAATDEQPYVTSSWPLVLDEVFVAPTWNLVLSQSEQEVLGPMVEFTEPFLGVVLLSSVLVLLLSVNQIRRSLLPLEELQKGTRRIAQRDFTSRVTVSSRDEFEELGTSFNAMATQLDRQFQALATAAEIDRAVLSARDAAEIVGTLLTRIRDVYPCGMVSVTLVAPDGAKSLPSVVHDYADGTRRQVRVDLRSADVQDLLEGPEAVAVEVVEGERIPSYLAPLADQGARSLFVLPLRFQRQLVGVIALGEREEGVPEQDDRLQVRRLADQAAIALANARMLQQVRTLAYYDSLTGLPNRLSYKERLSQALEQANRHEELVAAFFIDLDHFSRINDTLGHEIGDQLLQQVAGRLRASCREREDEIGPAGAALDPEVARLGGDEFTVIMPGLTDPQDAGKLARRILSSLAHPIRLEGREIFVNASIGIAIYPFDGEDLETLLMHADTAMYQAKELGGNSYQAYSKSMNATALQRLTLENSLRRALERGEFEVHYQPIMDARTGEVVAAEALVRWRHPEIGLLLPSEFVPLAEENGLIVSLGEWVLHSACAQNRAWQEAGLPPIRVLVNLSSRQLVRSLTDTVGRILHVTGLESRFLGLELTETVLVNHQKEGTDTLHALRAMGLYLSVDDFGTGYSSFSYLKHFPLDALKIERSFVREITSDPDDAAITTAIIAMGHALGIRVVAEGVETESQLALLRKQECDEMQGYLFSRPIPAERFAQYLAGKRPEVRNGTRRARSAGVA